MENISDRPDTDPAGVHPPERSQRRTFSKKAPDVRRQQLIDATFRCLCRHGAAETSVRTIAQEAGLSLGMVRHHFRSKDELLAATLQYLSDQVQKEIGAAMAQAGPTPVERLKAFITACLHPPVLDHDYVMARFLFWGLAQTNKSVRRAHDAIYDRFEKQLRALICDAARTSGAAVDVDLLTIMIMALLKGIWVEWSLSADRADPRKLVAQIHAVLESSLR